MNEKGQAAIEVIVIAVILLGLLLATALIITFRNADTQKMYDRQADNLKCHDISSKVTSFNSNRGYSETYLEVIQREAHFEKGNIMIGEINCVYAGPALKETSSGIYENDESPGFDLEEGILYKIKKIDLGVAFCDGLQDWC